MVLVILDGSLCSSLASHWQLKSTFFWGSVLCGSSLTQQEWQRSLWFIFFKGEGRAKCFEWLTAGKRQSHVQFSSITIHMSHDYRLSLLTYQKGTLHRLLLNMINTSNVAAWGQCEDIGEPPKRFSLLYAIWTKPASPFWIPLNFSSANCSYIWTSASFSLHCTSLYITCSHFCVYKFQKRTVNYLAEWAFDKHCSHVYVLYVLTCRWESLLYVKFYEWLFFNLCI